MSEIINKEAIFNYVNDWKSFDRKAIEEHGEAYKVTLKNNLKSVVITIPFEVGEFFLDFLINEQPYYSDWYEIMDDPLDDFMSYTEQVAKNFLFYDVQIQPSGWWIFKTDELQYLNGNNWCNVLKETS